MSQEFAIRKEFNIRKNLNEEFAIRKEIKSITDQIINIKAKQQQEIQEGSRQDAKQSTKQSTKQSIKKIYDDCNVLLLSDKQVNGKRPILDSVLEFINKDTELLKNFRTMGRDQMILTERLMESNRPVPNSRFNSKELLLYVEPFSRSVILVNMIIMTESKVREEYLISDLIKIVRDFIGPMPMGPISMGLVSMPESKTADLIAVLEDQREELIMELGRL